MIANRTPVANPVHAILPLLGTSSAFVVLMSVGFVMGGFAMMAM